MLQALINPRHTFVQGEVYRFVFCRCTSSKPDKFGFTDRPGAPANIGLGCPGIGRRVETGKSHDEMVAM
jgi:hypothetical protein